MTHPTRTLPHIRRGLAVIAAACCLLAGCSEDNAPAAPPTEAIQSEPPYLCGVIPESSVELMYATVHPRPKTIKDKVLHGDLTQNEFSCVVKTDKGFTLLNYFQHKGRGSSDRYEDKLSLVDEDIMDRIPTRIGIGWVDSSLGGYGGWALWNCDNRSVFSEFHYSTLPEHDERDLEEDTTRLLEIAQQRYAELNDCEIRPPASSPSKSTSRPTSRLTPPPEGAQP